VQALFATRETLKASVNGIPDETAPVTGSVLMSDRFSISSTKYGPSVRAAVNTHVELPVVGVVVVPPVETVSVALAAPDAQLRSTDCDTTTLAAPFAAKPSKSRRLSRVGIGFS
jgi:hypothetical protein